MKYAALGNYLDSLETDEKQLTLEQVSRIIGSDLPRHARKRGFWNNSTQGRAQAGPGWMNVGWRVKRLKKRGNEIVAVTFHRVIDESRGAATGCEIVTLTPEQEARMRKVPLNSIHAFRLAADYRIGNEFGSVLPPGEVATVHHRFDFVSPDGDIVGEARLFRATRDGNIHSATYASISEAVFLLQNAPPKRRFIVFGGDRRVPLAWLERHGSLVTTIQFYFLHENGDLELLQDAPLVRVREGGAR